jgi:peroxisomal 2,4-dienoyl-CoA reductase
MSHSETSSGIFAPDLLKGRVALITGGGSGIGLGIAECLARAGASVAIASRRMSRLEKAAAGVQEKLGVSVLPLPLDVRDPEAFRAAARTTAAELGSLDILVNNAAGNFYAPSADLSERAWRAVVEIDLFGTFHGCQAAFPIMQEQGYGRIVSTSMTLHYRGWPQMAHATAAKAGVKKAFAPRGAKVPDVFGAERAMEGYALKFIPVGRLGTPDDIGHMVTYLASPAGDWITGAIFVVDGGESLASPRMLEP